MNNLDTGLWGLHCLGLYSFHKAQCTSHDAFLPAELWGAYHEVYHKDPPGSGQRGVPAEPLVTGYQPMKLTLASPQLVQPLTSQENLPLSSSGSQVVFLLTGCKALLDGFLDYSLYLPGKSGAWLFGGAAVWGPD